MAVAQADSPPFIMEKGLEPVPETAPMRHVRAIWHQQIWGLQCTLGNSPDSIVTEPLSTLPWSCSLHIPEGCCLSYSISCPLLILQNHNLVPWHA